MVLEPREIGKGILLVPIIWFWLVFVAFVIFSPSDEHTQPIIWTWLVSIPILLIVLWWVGYLRLQSGLTFLGMLLLLVVLFLIPVVPNIPQEATEFNQGHFVDDRFEYAQSLFSSLTGRWEAGTREYLMYPHHIFLHKDFAYFWHLPENGYVPSNIQSQIYRYLLLESNMFTADEVSLRHGWCSNSPHGYIVIAHPDGEIYADLWAAKHFPHYEFGQRAVHPCDVLGGEGFSLDDS